MANENKIISGREKICSAYSIGKSTFYWLIEKGAPIKMLKNKYFVHRDKMDEFIGQMTIDEKKVKN